MNRLPCLATRKRLLAAVAVACALLLSAQQATARSYTLPDTGQTTCYNNAMNLASCPQPGQAFYGQDACYTGSPPKLTSTAFVVSDSVTGLTWQKTDDGQVHVHVDAVAVCEHLVLDGHSDWRLPTRMELLTIVDNTRAFPAINPVFVNTGNVRYWTSTISAADSSLAWSVRFTDGFTLYDGLANNYRVRCVRGPALQ